MMSNASPKETSTAEIVAIDGSRKKVLSRVDLCWRIAHGGRSHVFAILGLKRPGSIKTENWAPMLQQGQAGESARVISQQLSKYGFTHHTNKVAVCDLNTLVLLELEGSRDNWRGQIRNATQVGPSFRWITDKNEMKRNLYLFLYEAATTALRSTISGN